MTGDAFWCFFGAGESAEVMAGNCLSAFRPKLPLRPPNELAGHDVGLLPPSPRLVAHEHGLPAQAYILLSELE